MAKSSKAKSSTAKPYRQAQEVTNHEHLIMAGVTFGLGIAAEMARLGKVDRLAEASDHNAACCAAGVAVIGAVRSGAEPSMAAITELVLAVMDRVKE